MSAQIRLLVGAFALTCTSSWTTAGTSAPFAAPSPTDSLLGAAPPTDPVGALTLDRTLALARAHHPSLRSAAWRVRAAEARRREAARPPNPTLGLEVENVGGSLGTDRRESTVLATQPIELGGKARARGRTADALTALALAELSAEERQLLITTAERFLEAWSLQQQVERLTHAVRLAEQTIAAAQERFRAGAGPAVERVRAEAVLSLRQVDRLRANAELTAAIQRLVSQWGATKVRFDSLVLDAPERLRIPPPATLAASVENHPERRRAAAEVALEEARLREARAARLPDISLQGGVRHLAELDGTGFVAGVSMPLPLWNRQQGAVLAAEAERSAAASREQFIMLRLHEELRTAYERYQAAAEAHEALSSGVKPKTEEALRQLASGYRSGRFSSFELIEAQRSLLETELSLIEATADAWRPRHALERLIGSSLDDLRVPEEEGP